MPRHDNLSDLKQSLTEKSEVTLDRPEKNIKSYNFKREACLPISCGLLTLLGLLCGYLIHESYLIDDGSI